MGFRLTPRSMTLDDLELYKSEFSENFTRFRICGWQHLLSIWRYSYFQRMRCKALNVGYFLDIMFLALISQDFFSIMAFIHALLLRAYLIVI